MIGTTKLDLLDSLEENRERFLDFLEKLDPEDYNIPITKPDGSLENAWTIRDIIFHLSRWEAELIKLLWQVKQGQKPTSAFFLPPTKIDETNEQWHREGLGRSLDLILEDFHAVRNQTILRIENLSDTDLFDRKRYSWLKGKSLCELIDEYTKQHENDHLSSMVVWKESKQ